MGFFKVRRSLVIGGGSAQFGADVNLYRSAANTLKTDDSLTVAQTLIATTKQVVPYGTASPTVVTDGQIHIYHKSAKAYIAIQSGGTPMYLSFPTTTHGTPTFTIGGTP